VTTFGEPRIGNDGLRKYLDTLFELDSDETDGKDDGDRQNIGSRYRRITHIDDPVPLLPLSEWGFVMHGGEIYIEKPDLQPAVRDLRLCDGDKDPGCIYGGEADSPVIQSPAAAGDEAIQTELNKRWGLPARYRMWQLFFAHRDYFWRLGLCVPGGDPVDWGRRYDNFTDRDHTEGNKKDYSQEL